MNKEQPSEAEVFPPAPTEKSPAHVRATILELEHALAQIPDAFFGDSVLCPLQHSFAEGIYVREIFIPQGTILTGKIHKHAHPNFLMKGEVIVVTEEKGPEHLIAPVSMISQAGTKRAVLALQDTIWITTHHNPHGYTDLRDLEDWIIAESYDVLLQHVAGQGTSPHIAWATQDARIEESAL